MSCPDCRVYSTRLIRAMKLRDLASSQGPETHYGIGYSVTLRQRPKGQEPTGSHFPFSNKVSRRHYREFHQQHHKRRLQQVFPQGGNRVAACVGRARQGRLRRRGGEENGLRTVDCATGKENSNKHSPKPRRWLQTCYPSSARVVPP